MTSHTEDRSPSNEKSVQSIVMPRSKLAVDITEDGAYGRLRQTYCSSVDEEDWTAASPEPRIVVAECHVDPTRWGRPATTTVFGTGTSAIVAGITGQSFRGFRRTRRWPVTWASEHFWWCEVQDELDVRSIVVCR